MTRTHFWRRICAAHFCACVHEYICADVPTNAHGAHIQINANYVHMYRCKGAPSMNEWGVCVCAYKETRMQSVVRGSVLVGPSVYNSEHVHTLTAMRCFLARSTIFYRRHTRCHAYYVITLINLLVLSVTRKHMATDLFYRFSFTPLSAAFSDCNAQLSRT
jgi:hypothetical protein